MPEWYLLEKFNKVRVLWEIAMFTIDAALCMEESHLMGLMNMLKWCRTLHYKDSWGANIRVISASPHTKLRNQNINQKFPEVGNHLGVLAFWVLINLGNATFRSRGREGTVESHIQVPRGQSKPHDFHYVLQLQKWLYVRLHTDSKPIK